MWLFNGIDAMLALARELLRDDWIVTMERNSGKWLLRGVPGVTSKRLKW